MSVFTKQSNTAVEALPAAALVAAARPRAARGAWDPATLALGAVCAVLLGIVGRGALGHCLEEYRQPESYYAYAPAVPLLIALMFWHRRAAIAAAGQRPCYGALALLAPALVLLVAATRMEMPAAECGALLMVLWSGAWLVGGTRFVRAAWFPLAFFVFLAPLPGPLLNDATFGIQQLSTHMANSLLHVLTFQTTLTGNVINLDDYQVFVDVPCSGFKMLLALLTCNTALAFLLDGPAWRRLGLLLLSLPLGLAVNSVRLTLLCIAGECFGAQVAAVFHDWDGLLTVGGGVILLFIFARKIGCRHFAGWPLF